ncbi:MAG: hypothetical protein AB7F99_02645 [Vicinamibacterales bacterium]
MATRENHRRGRGRPLKFGRPARSVTVTLPDDVLNALRARDRDLGRAIVALLPVASTPPSRSPAVVLHQTGRRAVIVVRPVEALRRLPGVDLVSLGDPDRALIAFSEGMSAATFELRVQDLLESPSLPPDDAEVVTRLASLLRDVRRTARRSLSQATIIVLEDAHVPERRNTVSVRAGTRKSARP